jgi:uncharacterized protein YrrD
MIKFISQLIGARVILYQERALVVKVSRVLIDADNVALVVLAINPVHQKATSYIPLGEVKGFGQKLIIVESLESLSEPADVVRIEKVLQNEPEIIGALVVTEGGQKIGKVDDATLDLKFSSLKKLYVSRSFLPDILGEQKIIDARQIVKIEKKKIIVSDLGVKKRSALVMPEELPATE